MHNRTKFHRDSPVNFNDHNPGAASRIPWVIILFAPACIDYSPKEVYFGGYIIPYMQGYATYAKFYAPEEAEGLIGLLKQNDISYALEHEVNQMDRIYLGESPDPMFVLRIPGEQFKAAHAVLAKQARLDMHQPGFTHQMQSYDAAELQEILDNPEGWSAYDLEVAKELLAEKAPGTTITAKPTSEAFEPARVEKVWIVLGYLACLVGLVPQFFYVAAGGFFAGISIVQAKKTLKNGTTVRQYTPGDRTHGRVMMVLSLLFITIGFYWLLVGRYD